MTLSSYSVSIPSTPRLSPSTAALASSNHRHTGFPRSTPCDLARAMTHCYRVLKPFCAEGIKFQPLKSAFVCELCPLNS